MADWLTPDLAVLFMFTGVVPSLINVFLLYPERHQPGVLWFVASMAAGGAWSFLFATMTLVDSPGLTLALANLFWAIIPTAAVTMFLLAYEFVFKQTASRRTIAALFAPVVVLFALSWLNPGNLVFGPAYHVGPDGFLYFPPIGGPLKALVTKVYGYLLVVFAAGMFVGEAMRTTGIRRRQAIYLLVAFSLLVVSTTVKVAGYVPVYFDPTSVVYTFSGLLFAHSIRTHGLMKLTPIARGQSFQEANDAIVVVDPSGRVVDVNRFGRDLFGAAILGTPLADVPMEALATARSEGTASMHSEEEGERHFTVRSSTVSYGRGLTGEIVVFSEVTALKERETELELLKQILSRVFRHNVRNDINVIDGYAQFIRESGDDELAEYAEEIHEKAQKLLEHAEKARNIETVFTEQATVSRSLEGVVEHALAGDVETDGATVSTAVPDVPVELHPRFDLAVVELVENAVRHHVGDRPASVEVRGDVHDAAVVLTVADDGPGIPPAEIEALDAGEETALRHGSGIGLWLVRWIVTRSNGDLSITTGDEGTRFEIRLPRVSDA